MDLVAPVTLDGAETAVVFRQATLVTTTSYTTEGLVQMLGSGSIVDDALVYTYFLRYVQKTARENRTPPPTAHDLQGEGSSKICLS